MAVDLLLMKSRVLAEFDIEYYLIQASSPPEEIADPVIHYLESGWRALRDPSPNFSTGFYLEQYADVRESGINPFYHYIVQGREEGRSASPSDQNVTINALESELKLTSDFFDEEYYILQVPELSGEAKETLVEHYIQRGWRALLDPSPEFSTSLYLENNADVRDAGSNPLYHYIAFGRAEGRDSYPSKQKLGGSQAELLLELETRPPVQIQNVGTDATNSLPNLTEPPLGAQQESDVRAIAFYLPQFHPTEENDKWWGKGFTEWRNVTRATPLFKDHYQPHFPADLGFYDLRLDDVRHAQIDLARQAGLHGFCFYYYWFNGRRILERPLDRYVADKKIDFPFCICWANENWSRMWDGGNREVLLVQEHDYKSDMQFIRDIIPLMKDPRYIRVNGKPLLLLYRQDLMKNAAETAEGWRRECEAAGLPGVYLCCVQSFKMNDPHEFGFDAACEFPPHQYKCGVITDEVEDLDEDFKGTIYDFEMVARQSLTRPPMPYKLMRGIFPNWDNSARKRQDALVFHRAGPKPYEYWLRGLVEYTRRNLEGDERIIFINAWNEWAEGAHLEPDLKNGHAYIEATHRALTSQTAPDALFSLLECRVAAVELDALREELRAYIEEARSGYRELETTIKYFQSEKIVAERMALERSSSIFVAAAIEDVIGAAKDSALAYNLECINGGACKNGQLIDAHVTNYLQGWLASDGVIPDAQTTMRFMLLRGAKTGQIYIAHIYSIQERNDVVRYLPSVNEKYTRHCGFKQLFSFAHVPSDTYNIGYAMKSDSKVVLKWSEQSFQLIG
jgi:hypothetical protein